MRGLTVVAGLLLLVKAVPAHAQLQYIDTDTLARRVVGTWVMPANDEDALEVDSLYYRFLPGGKAERWGVRVREDANGRHVRRTRHQHGTWRVVRGLGEFAAQVRLCAKFPGPNGDPCDEVMVGEENGQEYMDWIGRNYRVL